MPPRVPFLLGLLALAACQGSPLPALQPAQPVPSASITGIRFVASPAPGPSGPHVAIADLLLAAPDPDGSIQVAGRPGAVVGAAGVRLIAQHVISVKLYHALHLGVTGPHNDYVVELARADVAVAADGSFPATPLGDRSSYVQPGDQVELLPLAGQAQAGPSELAIVPGG